MRVYAYGKDLASEETTNEAEKWCIEIPLFGRRFLIWIRSFKAWNSWKRIPRTEIGLGYLRLVFQSHKFIH